MGATLTATTGAWTGTAPVTYAYQWRRCDSSGASCVDISSATGSTYVPVVADVGATLRAVVTGLNAEGSAAAASAQTPSIVDSYVNAVLADTPRVYWRLGESTGATAYDMSGNDAANRLITVTTALGKVWTFGYDANGNVTSVVDAIGNATSTAGDGTTTYAYDVLDRLTSITYSDGTPSVGYSYDAAGNRTQMTDGDGTQTSTYDSRNRRTQVARGTDTFSYSYDAEGDIAQRTYPGGRQTDYTYTDDGQLAAVASGGATTSYSYDPAGELLRTDLPSSNGYAETRTYNRAGLLTEVRNANSTATLSYADYAYDAVGNPTQITTQDGPAALSYDSRDRLTEVCYQASCPGSSDPFIRYAYDAVGNRTSETRPAGTTSYAYDAADQLTAVGSSSYTFDADGRQTQAGSRSFTWNLADRLTSTSDGTTTTTYGYDGDGNRTLASTGASASQNTKYLWDINNGLPQLAVERDGGNTELRNYLQGLDTISMDSGGAPYYYHHDGIGSIVSVTSGTGATEWSYAYEPFGAPKTATQNDTNAPSNALRYAGEYLDPSSGLTNLRARQYDTSSGHFLSTDPLPASASDPSSSTYIYANNDPLAYIDPSGMGAVWDNGGRGCVGFVGNAGCATHFVGPLPRCCGGFLRPALHAIAPFATECAANAVIGGVTGLVTGPGVLVGAAVGCTEGVIVEGTRQTMGEEAGLAVELVGNAVTIRELGTALTSRPARTGVCVVIRIRLRVTC